MDSNIFGAKLTSITSNTTADSSDPVVTVLVSPSFMERYPHTVPASVVAGSWLSIPVAHWMDAMHDGYAPKINPHASSRALASHLPMNILSRFFV